MRTATGLFILSFLFGTSTLCGQQTSFQDQLEIASQHPAVRTFYRPLDADDPIGTWSITASVEPDYWYVPAYFHLSGSYRSRGGTFTYREIILGLPFQIALLRTAHPDMSETEIESHLLFAELRFESSTQLPEEGNALITALRNTQGPVLPERPGAFSLHPTTYSVRSRQGSQSQVIYAVEGWRGRPQDLETEISQGLKEAPLVVLLNRWRFAYLNRWKAEQRKDRYARFMDRLDMPALGVAIFEWACSEGEFDLAESLLNRGLSPRTPGPDGSLPMISACQAGNRLLAQRLLEGGSHLDTADANGCTPLAAACSSGNLALVEWVIAHGVRPQFPSDDETPFNPLQVAVNQNSLALVQAVFGAAGTIPDSLKQGAGTDLLAFAISPDITRWLLDQGFKPTARSLQNAARMGSIERMRALLDAGADPNAVTPFSTPLMEAIGSGHLEAVELLLSREADPRIGIRHQIPANPLEKAKSLSQVAMVELITKALAKYPTSEPLN